MLPIPTIIIPLTSVPENDLYIEQGATFNVLFTVIDSLGAHVTTSNYTVLSYIRAEYLSTTSTPFTITTSGTSLNFGLSATQTMALVPGRYVYDAQFADTLGNVTRFTRGIVTVYPTATY